MSSSRALRVLVALVAAGPVAAQSVEDMGRRVDSTLRIAAIVRDSLAAYRNANPVRFIFDDSATIGGGRVKIYYNASSADLARAGAAEAERNLQEFGRALEKLPPFVFSIVPDTGATSYDERLGRVGAVNVRRHLAESPNNPNKTSVEADAKAIAYVIVLAVSNHLSWGSESRVARWSRGGLPLAPDLLPANDWSALRLDVVSSASPLGRACFLGDVRACRNYLAIDTTAESPENAASSAYARSSVVTHALKVGGARSAERLLLATGSVGDALAAAAGMPLDSLIAGWRQGLDDRSGTAGHVAPGLLIASVAWVGLCFFLATRSARWR